MSTYDEQSGATPSRTGGGPQAQPGADGAQTARFSAPGAASSGGAEQRGAGGSSSADWAGPSDSRFAPPSADSSYRADASASPYTAAPRTPAGYSFARSSSAPGSTPRGDAPGGYGAGAEGRLSYGSVPSSPSSSTPVGEGGGRRGPGWGGVVATSVVVALLACGGTAASLHYFDKGAPASSSTSAPTAIATGSTTQTVSSTGTAPDWEAVTAAVSNAVVSITVQQGQNTAAGSGVIYDSSGHIVTNNHVVAGASRIQVTLADGRIYEAKLTGTDPATDLAVVALENAPSDLTVAQIGDSSKLVTGQDVMAIGNPLGLSSTATTGIISALNRPVITTQQEGGSSDDDSSGNRRDQGGRLGQNGKSASQVVTNAVQIDAAVNPGNSGGPLFDETGMVIGITSSIASTGTSSSDQPAGSIGIGFAIPSNLVQKVADQLISTGTATHAYLGVTIGNGGGTANGVTRAGAEVGTVEPGSPAETAGLKEGDVITAIDGKATPEGTALTGFVRQYSAGDQVTLTVIRDGQEIETTATLSERKDS
ncbi:trypsin-like peptidase domain-containing protein [Actinomyces israelii]|uniref:Trypsin-like peptidase domain-containing protein n=1 Tax=Actinomyces israelii TaxID=1659 RepID=A0ABT4I8M2_9ACTO|nr:trypsin-like peptidase domain-containing protein [Actinomyces israelii]MCZ0858098.1 trypsin-like peptidase domain-containing protein [Actinomyces israelii]